MNNELIKRIDNAIANMAINSDLLRDCKAEIERLSKPYVPMSVNDWALFQYNYLCSYEVAQKIEAEVCRMAGLEVVK